MSDAKNRKSPTLTSDGDELLFNRAGDWNGTELPLQPPASDGVVLGEIVDTHHPHLPARVRVQWHDPRGDKHDLWLEYAVLGNCEFQAGDRVLLTRPFNWPEWVVVSVFSGQAGAGPMELRNSELKPEKRQPQVLRLEKGQSLRVEGAEHEALFDVSVNHRGEMVLKTQGDLRWHTDGEFSVQAEKIVLRSAEGGTDSRSDGDVVVRGKRILLN